MGNFIGRITCSQAKHDVRNKDQLLSLVRKFPEGIAIIDLKDAYPTVMDDLQVFVMFIPKHVEENISVFVSFESNSPLLISTFSYSLSKMLVKFGCYQTWTHMKT